MTKFPPEAQARIDELERENAALRAENGTLREQVEALLKRVEALEEEQGRNSSNSGKPPSSDSPAARIKRRRTDKVGQRRKRGGQKGHRGHSRALVPPEKVDERVDVFPTSCGKCGGAVQRQPDPSAERHQVAEIPPIQPQVTEYLLHGGECVDCGCTTRAVLPAGVPRGAFGPRLVALVALLTGQYRLSKRRTSSLLSDVLGLDISTGAISRCEQRISNALRDAVDAACAHVQQQAVKYCDATSWKQGIQKLHLWTIACAMVTVFRVTVDGTRDTFLRLIGKPQGVLVSDRASVFESWDKDKWQVCWAHMMRAFVAISERKGRSARVGRHLLKEARRLFKWWHRCRDGTYPRQKLQERIATSIRPSFRALLEEGSTCEQKKTRGTCKKLLKHFDSMWTFIELDGVEPTNNESEQELRPAVLWRRTSFSTKSERGDRYIERIMTVVATLRKQERDVFKFLESTYRAALSGDEPPSLLPLSGDTT